eukprot:2115274-Rhodomonas_salina.1
MLQVLIPALRLLINFLPVMPHYGRGGGVLGGLVASFAGRVEGPFPLPARGRGFGTSLSIFLLLHLNFA